MTDFPVDQGLSDTPVDFAVETPENPSSAAVADRTVSLAGKMGTPPQETIQASEIGDKTSVLQAKQQATDPVQSTFSRNLEAGTLSLSVFQQALNEAQEKASVAQELEDYFVEAGVLTEGAEYTVTDLRHTINMNIAEQLFRDKISEVAGETSIAGYVGDFVDRYFIRHFPIGAYEDLTRRSERKGQELLQASIELNPKEYKAFIEAYIEELSEEGVFVGDNIFALQDGFQEAVNAGYDPMAGVNQLLTLGDVVGLGVAGKNLKMTKAISKADHPVTKVAALEGQEAAAEFTEKAVEATAGLDNTVKAKAGPSMFDPGDSVVKPQSAKVAEIAENNSLVSKVRELQQSGAFGAPDPLRVRAEAERVAEAFSKRITNLTNNIRVAEDLTGNPIAEVTFGKVKDGTPFKRESDAVKAAKKLPEAKAAPVDPEDLSKGWVVQLDARIDTRGLSDEFDVNNVEYDFVRTQIARFLGSNAATDDEQLNALANMAESSAVAVRRQADPLLRSLNKVSQDSKRAINRVLTELRDGSDASLKEGYNRAEFTEKFQEKHPKGLLPSKKDMDAWDAIQEIEDAGWLLRANQVLNNYVAKGFWSVDLGDGVKSVGKRVEELPGEVRIFNAETGVIETAVNPDIPVWRLDIPMKDTQVEYVTNPRSVDVLDHSDVMGFNAGGRRLNPDANHFVVLDDAEHPKAIITAFTEKQARKAVEQLSNLQAAVKRMGGDIASIKPTEALDDLVRANNDWNPSITTFQEFAELVARKGWDLSKTVSKKERDGEVENVSKNSPLAGEKWENYVATQTSRYDETLMDFGGSETYNVDPVSAILGEFANAATHYTHRQYTYDAASAWTKRAAREGSGVKLSDSYAKNDWLNQVQHAEVVGNSASARALRHQRSIIRRRLKMKGPIERRFEALGQEAAEFVFDKTGFKIRGGNPADKMLGLGFQTAFGFFNVSQFFMQGLHSLTITAISPQAGLRAASALIPLRLVMHAPNPAVEAFARKRLAKSMGIEDSEVKELIDYIRTSGRDIVDGDAIELGTGPSYGISGWGENSYLPSRVSDTLQAATNGGRRVLDAGLIPFRTGERMSRQTAMMTAFFEFKQRFPKQSALSREGRQWITNREQNLTFNMTSSGRALFQEGLMRFPTQWLSYTFRSMEAVVLGRGFTPAERARMAAILMPFYGLTGMGFGSAANSVAEQFGVEDTNAFIAMKYGFIDWLIAESTDVETGLATRLAPVTGFTDLYKRIVQGEATTMEVLMGPSGDVTQRTLGTLWNALEEVYNGHSVSLTEDAIAVLRTPSGLDNVAKGIGVLQNGLYRSKTGTTVPTELKPSDAIALFMGFAPLEVTEFYAQKGLKYTDEKKLRRFRKEMTNDFQRALTIFREDPERGKTMMSEIHTKIALSGFTRAEQQTLRRGLVDVNYGEIVKLQQHLIKKDQQGVARLMGEILGDSE